MPIQKKTLTIIIIALIILVSSFLLNYLNIIGTRSILRHMKNYLPKISTKIGVSRCFNKSDKFSKYVCFSRYAISENDITLCDNIDEEWHRYDCLIHFYKDKDVSNRSEFCSKLMDERTKEKCIIDLSVDFGMVELCYELPYEVIESIDSKRLPRDSCIIAVASKLKDSSICDLMEDKLHIQWCKSGMKI